MVIKASAGAQVEALLAWLASDDAAVRDAAVARLTIIGPRAVDRLIAIAGADRQLPARIAALSALEAIADPRCLPLARRLVRRDQAPELSTAAVSVLRAFLTGPHGLETLDALAGLALDKSRPDAFRTAVIAALVDLPAGTVAPLWARLRDEGNPALAVHLPPPGRTASLQDPAALLRLAATGVLPDTPASLRQALRAAGPEAPLPVLQQIVDHVRAAEHRDAGPHGAEWRLARGAAHALLARRGSRLALYDLKESIAAADGPLPVDFLAALERAGDASCLEAIGVAHANAVAGGEALDWWRTHLVDAFRAIVRREKLTRRSTQVKRVVKRWPESARALLP